MESWFEICDKDYKFIILTPRIILKEKATS